MARVTTAAAWAGIIVSDLEASLIWYLRALGAALEERDGRWAKLSFPNGSCVELFEGDLQRPGATFLSYGDEVGPPVMPGYAVDDPAQVAHGQGLRVVRSLPGWVVVAAPDRLRVALIATDVAPGRGLVGFRFTSTHAADQRDFLGRLAVEGPEIADGEVAVVPVVRGRRGGELVDPDGTPIVLVPAPQRPPPA
jgi:catechol 2,3-dioxygenase-like lactoylglutathione lyase family enzyme